MKYQVTLLASFYALIDAFHAPPSERSYDIMTPVMKRQREFSCFYSDNEPLLRRRASTIGGGSTSLFCSPAPANVDGQDGDAPDIDHAETEKDTIRVRIWRVLAFGDEVSMTQLCKRVGERRGDVRSHLKHVERQAKTIRNKSNEWRMRRGLLHADEVESGGNSTVGSAKKVRLKMRKGAKNEIFIRLV